MLWQPSNRENPEDADAAKSEKRTRRIKLLSLPFILSLAMVMHCTASSIIFFLFFIVSECPSVHGIV